MKATTEIARDALNRTIELPLWLYVSLLSSILLNVGVDCARFWRERHAPPAPQVGTPGNCAAICKTVWFGDPAGNLTDTLAWASWAGKHTGNVYQCVCENRP